MKTDLPLRRLKIYDPPAIASKALRADLEFKNGRILFILIILTSYFLLLASAPLASAHAQMLPPYGGGLQTGVYGGISNTGTITPTPIIPPASSDTVSKTPTVTPTPIISGQPPTDYGPGSLIGGRVGDLYLSLSGFSSPFSSIALISDGFTLRSIVSDPKGNFSLSQVLIKTGFSNFCLKAVDAKNLGESTTCININPAKESLTIKDIFLPPTLGLWKKEVNYFQENLVYGYTMSNAQVVLHISSGKTLTTKADINGYFKFILKLPAGKYNLFSTAKYNNIDSKTPSKTIELNVLSAFGLIIQMLKDLINQFITFLTSLALGPLWLVIPIIILIIILIFKLWKDKFISLFGKPISIFFSFLPHEKRLHHYWWVGY